jgi:hypothetical protein
MEETQKSQKELEHLLALLQQGKLHGREVYRAVQLFGENHFLQARPEVEALLHSDAPDVRFVALKVLTQYWRLSEHWETARSVLFHDPDTECRFRAAGNLGSLEMNTQDERTLELLAQVVCNTQEEPVVRESAYAALLGVLHYDPREQFHIATRSFDFNKEVDWPLVQRYRSH